MEFDLAEAYLVNSKNLRFFKKNKKAHQTHYREDIKNLTKFAYLSFHNLKKIPLPGVKAEMLMEKKLADVIMSRSSRREYSKRPMTMDELSALLFYSAGARQIDPVRKRNVPSGGNLNSVDLFFFSNNIAGLDGGFYFYDFMDHSVVQIKNEDFKQKLCDDILYQPELAECSMFIIFVSNYERLNYKYGKRALRITHIDCGILSENVHLVAEAMDLSCCSCGGVIESPIEELLDINGIDNFVVLGQAVGPNND